MKAEFEFMKEIMKASSIMRKGKETITTLSFGQQMGIKESTVVKINFHFPLF